MPALLGLPHDFEGSMKKGGPIAADRLLSFFERIERLEEERAAIGSDIKDVFSEAKGVGYDTKTMRKVLALDIS
jgi:uncharacterized protein (UPF0335 family)